MSAFDSGNVKLDPVDVRLRSFGIRLTAAEKLFTHVTRVNAAPGPSGPQGEPGPQGPRGPEGPIGPIPAHEWEGTALRFEQPDGQWGELVDLQGPQGLPGTGGGGIITLAGNSWTPSGW